MNEDTLMRLVEALETATCSLERIAEALEDVNDKLDSCMSRTQQGAFLCVTGNVTNY